MEIYAPPEALDPLFAIDLVPSGAYEHKGARDRPEIETLLGRRNRILVGVPQITDLGAVWPHNQRLSAEIEAFRPDWDFYHMRFACSFQPDRGCRFGWARFGVHLVTREAVSSALAFDLFPRHVNQESKYRRSFKIEPKLKFAFAEATMGLGTEEEGLRYEPRIIGSGLLTAEPTWTFESAGRQGHTGIYEMFLLVKKRKGIDVLGRFTIGAEIRTHLGPIPMKRYRNDEIIDDLYPLIPA